MAKLTATVESHPYYLTAKLRYYTDQGWQHLELETSAWFHWLTGNQQFRYTYTDCNYQQTLSFTVRPETRGRQTYWWGWKTVSGQTRKKYLGTSEKLTRQKLDEAGQWFGQQVRRHTPQGQNNRWYALTVDLVWLAERLLEENGLPETQTRLYRQKLVRLKETIADMERELE